VFNRKKNLKPYFKDYQKDASGFKKYIVETIEYLRKQGDEKAIAFDLDALIVVLPDDITPDGIIANKSPALRQVTRDLMQKLGWAVFGDMLADMGLDKEMVDAMTSGATNKTGKNIPGSRTEDSVKSSMAAEAEALHMQLLKEIAEPIDLAIATNNPSLLDAVINAAQSAMDVAKNMGKSGGPADEVVQELIDSTLVFQELIDADKTTVEEYQAFLNKLVAFFIEDEVVETNKVAMDDHSKHDANECEMVNHPTEPLKVLYRRFYDDKDESAPPIENLSLIVFDTVRGVVHPIAFSIHDALTPRADEAFNKSCRSDKGQKFIVEAVMSFVNDDKELAEKVMDIKPFDDEHNAAVLKVQPDVISPSSEVLRRLLDEVRVSYDADAESVFANLNPDDFH
jgi:hypothetical protein